MNFKFTCSLCSRKVTHGKKFSIDCTEWESEHVGGYGGIDEESLCENCHDDIEDKVNSMRK